MAFDKIMAGASAALDFARGDTVKGNPRAFEVIDAAPCTRARSAISRPAQNT